MLTVTYSLLERIKEMIKKYYPIFIAVLKRTFRSLHLVLSATLAYSLLINGISSLSAYTDDDMIVGKVLKVATPVGVILVFFVFLLCFSLYDEDSKHRYLVHLKENGQQSDFKANLQFMRSFKFRYTDYIALFIYFLMFKGVLDNFARGIMSEWAYQNFGFFVFLALAAVFLALYFFSSVLGASLWANELYSHDYESYNPNKLISVKGVFTVLIYLLDIVLIFAVIPAILTYIGIFAVLIIDYFKFFASIFVALFIFFYIRAHLRRRSFMKELKRVCKSNGAEMKIYLPARSIYLSGRRALTLTKGDRKYDVYFLPSMFKSNILRIYDEFKYNKIFKIEMRRRNKFLIHIPVSFKKKVRFKRENTEVLVANPVTKCIQVKEKGINGARELHEADKIWGIGVYSGEGFRNAFDRACREMQRL